MLLRVGADVAIIPLFILRLCQHYFRLPDHFHGEDSASDTVQPVNRQIASLLEIV